MNAWLLYRTKIHADLKEQEPDNRMSKQQGELSKVSRRWPLFLRFCSTPADSVALQIIAEMWRNEDPAVSRISKTRL